ncbi:hypothetical protein SLEP1_g1069 [Rubroshorea leprosula]|uniref:Bifunctional inhibitor/plant lipid transfer protein/seed storage helical domain-containing protein n=1 Tax=Rubroshorea leprosula TaxID=152421 RepID=A0AAV5HCM4_9ROSI|nr:hypothetical protein SLEP1_g1069 [Rubroshorea leprosula]
MKAAFRVLQLMISIIATLTVFSVNGQITTPCTTSMITSFTPCLNFITGSTANGVGTPSQSCCSSLKSLMSSSMDCACLIITANVPIPINPILALNLTQVCNVAGAGQCKATGTPLPAPGPVPLFRGPALPPRVASPLRPPPLSPRASKDATAAATPALKSATPLDLSPASPPAEAEAPKTSPGVRPVLTPSASDSSSLAPATVLFILIGFMLFKSC